MKYSPRTTFPEGFTGHSIVAGDRSRHIGVPDEPTLRLNRELLTYLQEQEAVSEYAHGGVKGRSLKTNVEPHAKSRHFYMLDIASAFPSVNGEEIATLLGIMEVFPTKDAAQDWLSRYCLDSNGGLILGAPASPALFNLLCFNMDKELGEFCEENDIVYTRYLDDFTFSVPEKPLGQRRTGTLGKKRRSSLRDIIQSYGWEINHARGKSRVHSLDNGPVTITGISLYPDGRWQLSAELVAKAKAKYQEAREQLFKSGFLTQEEKSVIDGYNGVVMSTHDPRHPKHYTPIERELLLEYEALCRAAKEHSRRLGGPAVQIALPGFAL